MQTESNLLTLTFSFTTYVVCGILRWINLQPSECHLSKMQISAIISVRLHVETQVLYIRFFFLFLTVLYMRRLVKIIFSYIKRSNISCGRWIWFHIGKRHLQTLYLRFLDVQSRTCQSGLMFITCNTWNASVFNIAISISFQTGSFTVTSLIPLRTPDYYINGYAENVHSITLLLKEYSHLI